jgi:hypothetical protein
MREVIARMRAIGRGLPPADGIAAFTSLYLAVTVAVDEHVRAATFEDPGFVRRLDVAFANLYFDALDGRPPRAWAPLLACRRRRDLAPLQFALAGMNAHINRDLPVALVQTCEAAGLGLRRRSPQQRDYRRVNALLTQTEEHVKALFLTGPAATADVALGHVDDVVAMWSVERAREGAWVHAETLWALRDSPQLSARYLLTLDRLVGFAGRGLLRPL